MKVTRITETSYNVPDASVVRDNLEKLASQHKVSVDVLVKSAESAGTNAQAYQVRALNLKRRLDRLESQEE